MPARLTRLTPKSDRGAGWWSGCTTGSTARVVSWSAGRSWSTPIQPFCISLVPSSASSSVIAYERRKMASE